MARAVNKKTNSVEAKYPRIKMNIFPLSKPDFRKIKGMKDEIIKEWLKNWISSSLKSGEIQQNNLLPLKADLAYYFGVGVGTVQNAVRKLEDEGIVVSKQRIGTLIASSNNESMKKLTSKRDTVVEQIKSYICENSLKKGETLPTIRELEEIIEAKRNTIRSAIEYLALKGYIKSVENSDENKVWIISKEISSSEISDTLTEITSETLAQKISKKIEDYITENCKIGDRIDAISVWANRFEVSEKTAYDAMQMLFDRGVIKARRGRYGTIVVKMPTDSAFQPPKEMSIFMPAADAAVYSYKRIENFIRNMIKDEYSIGQKLPSMKKLSETMDVSTNTIRKAVLALASEGYLKLERGRFGGIYVIDVPEESAQSFRWLAVNPQYVKSYR